MQVGYYYECTEWIRYLIEAYIHCQTRQFHDLTDNPSLSELKTTLPHELNFHN